MSPYPEASPDDSWAITDGMSAGVYTLDRDGRVASMNPAAKRLLGWSQGQLLGIGIHDRIHVREGDDAAQPATRPIEWVIREGQQGRMDGVFIARDGRELTVSFTTSPLLTESGHSGTVVVFTDLTAGRQQQEQPLREEIKSRQLSGQLRAALREDRLRLYAQPIVDLRDGKTASYELLLRVIERDGAVRAPSPFLRAAERDGFITELDAWVIDQATAVAAVGVTVHVNVSARTVGHTGFLQRLRNAIDRHLLDPALIVLELTETAVLEPSHRTHGFLTSVREIGCRLALDDFGTGYAGLSRLKWLSADELKIDREFVQDLLTNDRSRYVVQAAVTLARCCGQTTIAEGVEDPATVDLLRELGVDLGQGYLFAAPFSVADLAPLTAAALLAATRSTKHPKERTHRSNANGTRDRHRAPRRSR